MNTLPLHKRVQIINMLVEGNSMRAISRMADVSINTVTKLLVDVGRACAKYHDEKVVGLKCERIQADEIWSFVYSKQKNVPEGMEEMAGDVWTWTAIDADTKLMVSYAVGSRDAATAELFIKDVASRLKNKIQLTTDGLSLYIDPVEKEFEDGIDYAQLVKIYGTGSYEENNKTARKYSPAKYVGSQKTVICGDPRMGFVSTSYVERQNLTMRMHMRRFTRLTNAFSKKIENHYHAIALHFVYYNFVKIHKSLSVAPAMQAGLIKRIMTIEDIANLVEERKPNRPSKYNKK